MQLSRILLAWVDGEVTFSSPCNKQQQGCELFFDLEPTAGDGWDAEVCAAAGLPTAGVMLLELHVHSVE